MTLSRDILNLQFLAPYLVYPAADGDCFDLFDRARNLKIFAGWEFHRGLKEYCSTV